MRILHYITGISPTIGGIEKFVLNFYDIQKDDVEIQILTRYCNPNTLMYKMFEEREIKINSLDIHHLTVKTMATFRNKLKYFFFNHGNEFDVLHIHCIEDPFVAKIAKNYGIKKIITHVHSYQTKSKILTRIVKNIAINNNCKIAIVCLACSLDVGYKVYPKRYKYKVKMLQNGIDTLKFDFNEDMRRKYRKEMNIDDSFVLCSVGRLEAIKNYGFLIEIFENILKKNSKSKLILVGDGRLKNRLYNKCVKDGIVKNVFFLGDRKDVNNILQASDSFILTSKSEGLGIVLVEAQASGLKTFVSADVIPKAVGMTDLITFISLDEPAEKWAECILQDALNYNRVSKCNEIVMAGFDSREASERLMEIYRQGGCG